MCMCGAWRHFWERVLGEEWCRPCRTCGPFLESRDTSVPGFFMPPPGSFAQGRLSRMWFGRLSRLESDDFHLSFED